MVHNKKGFTLIEMLVVVAIIAVLVAIMIPAVSSFTKKARAATDAANLQSVLEVINVELTTDKSMEDITKNLDVPDSKVVPGAKVIVDYVKPACIYVYYVNGTDYYGLPYLSNVALNGSSDIPLTKPVSLGTLYQVGAGEIH